MQIKNAFGKPFCVYAHVIRGTIIYIGSGSIGRAFDRNRSPLWREATKGKSVTVRILAWFGDSYDACDYEGRMIDHHRPICNYRSVRGCGSARAFLPQPTPPKISR